MNEIETTYVIVPEKEVTDSIVEASKNTPKTLRKSLDGTLVVLKFDSPYPDVARGYAKLNHKEILELLSSAAWNHTEVPEKG